MTEPEQPLSRRALRDAKAGRRVSPASVPADAVPNAVVAEGETAAADAASRGGIGAFVKRHPRAVLTTALSVGFLLLATGALFAGVSVGSAAAVEPEPVVTATPEPEPRPVPDTIAAPSRLRTCSIDALALDERLTTLYGSVINASTGELLWDRQAATPVRTASVLKVLTAAVALSALGPDYRLTTRVVAGTTPGSVVLVGGGDATLSRLPPGQESVYPGAPKLDDLAAQTVAAYAAANPDAPGITEVVLDSTYWNSADKWDSSWARSEQTIGYHSEVTALQVDGDRDNPARTTSPRSTDPVARAGQAFAQALANAGNPAGVPTITVGAAVATTVLGQVQSQPVSTLIGQMLPNSDNTLAEMLARVSSRAIGLDGSAASLNQTFTGVLNTYGVPTTGISIRDGSGLSDLNAVPPQYVAQLFVVINGGGQNLGVITNALPVAGVSGGLANRFTGANAVARGAVLAKTGWIDTSYSLAGIVRAADGSVLTFSFHAIRDGIAENARAALDTLTTGVFTCGDNLSNN
ncbi:D-alanyl-D-alanine carboxypeptidase/D-alanyl-D-alanine endopeptidase [Microcella sp.]|uniref:D-alanyl-D-alanine carboxypeptidase/D-alanyl-D-alanine endopeptidase n=1 Tax=Microcella sp. TaxID=1913979 RepID=UPI003F6E7E7D